MFQLLSPIRKLQDPKVIADLLATSELDVLSIRRIEYQMAF
jgi:hypothetical protein